MAETLKLFWWDDAPNFGDRISADIAAHLSGREVEWAAPDRAELFSVGSIMQFVRQGAMSERTNKPWVWGTGCMKPIRRDFVNHARFACVRGPITEEILRLNKDCYGDPGLLMPDVVGEKVNRGDAVGIVPHHTKIDALKAKSATLPREVEVIDVRAPDHLGVVRQIASCRLLFSSSLHGLIIADAFGVPNVWLDPRGNHGFARFKFYDYAASVGRALGRPIAIDAIGDALDHEDAFAITYGAGIVRAQADLRRCFPKDLTADKTDDARVAALVTSDPKEI